MYTSLINNCWNIVYSTFFICAIGNLWFLQPDLLLNSFALPFNLTKYNHSMSKTLIILIALLIYIIIWSWYCHVMQKYIYLYNANIYEGISVYAYWFTVALLNSYISQYSLVSHSLHSLCYTFPLFGMTEDDYAAKFRSDLYQFIPIVFGSN